MGTFGGFFEGTWMVWHALATISTYNADSFFAKNPKLCLHWGKTSQLIETPDGQPIILISCSIGTKYVEYQEWFPANHIRPNN